MSNTFSIFRTSKGKQRFLDTYDQTFEKLWDVPYESYHVKTRYGDTYVVECGPKDAPPLILLHGMTFNSIMWCYNVPILTNQYRVYCVDTLGDYGKSVVSRPLANRQDCAEWLLDVLHGLNLDQITLIGHSMGGWLSLNFALAYPDKVSKLILLAPIMSVLRLPLKFMLKVYPVILLPKRKRILKLWEWFVAEGNRLDKDLEEIIVQGWLHCKPQLKVIPSVFKPDEWSRLQPTTLFLVGEDEVVYDAHKAVKRVERLNPNVQIGIIPQSNHCFIAEQHELVNTRIMNFLAL